MSLRKNPTLKSCKIKVGITIGDPSGIGPAITLKAIKKLKGLAEFVVIGDKWVFNQVSGLRSQVSGVNFIDLSNVSRKDFSFGKIRPAYGKASIEYLDKALELIKKGQIESLVTCPISKEAINLAGFSYSGHTEYFTECTQTKNTVMMLLNKQLKFSLVTRHIPLKTVSGAINKDTLYKTISITYAALKNLFVIENPRIVVCGLNPHASDNGIIGKEENQLIKPVLNRLKRKIPDIDGPLSSDVAIAKAGEKAYDCVIAMYHDQALIPLKLLGRREGVNITLGLPFIRTSPLHGTAFDIAKDFRLANPNSLIEAIKVAVKCTLNLKCTDKNTDIHE
jgi:4-hydroxythreonine-4-phosphate dehydrogenase